MPDSLFLEGVLLPLRTGAALLAALVGGLLIGASGPMGTGAKATRGLLPALGLALAGLVLGLALPSLVGADALGGAAMAASLVAGALIGAGLVPTSAIGAGALAAALALLAGQVAFARFLPGELPWSVPAGAGLALGLTIALPAALVRTARALATATAPHRAVEIGTRVLGSWVGAVALLMLALGFVPR